MHKIPQTHARRESRRKASPRPLSCSDFNYRFHSLPIARMAGQIEKLLDEMRTHYDELAKLQGEAMVGTCLGYTLR